MSIGARCPDPEQLRRLLLGQLPDEIAEGLERHVEQCEHCGDLLATLPAEDPLVEAMRARATIVFEAAELQTIRDLIPRLQVLHLLAANHGDTKRSVARVPLASLDLAALFGARANGSEIGRLGPYRVLKLLGQGGMGAVFLAEDTNLQRIVALKVMLPEVAKKASAKDRFLREARATAKIEHDHIVTIYQVGEDRGVPFVAMQLLKGTSLEDLLQERQVQGHGAPIQLVEILKWGQEIATGLAAAHEKGLIHRDIKPANIWLDSSVGGRVKILDFGLVEPVAEEGRSAPSGMIAGTAAYMAPEQTLSDKIDGRSDLFSLGCLLYQLCTGRLPWSGSDAIGTLVAAATERPTAVRNVNPALPAKLAELVMQLLSKNPADRPASAQHVVDALTQIKREQLRESANVALTTAAPMPATHGGASWIPSDEEVARTTERQSGSRRVTRGVVAAAGVAAVILAAVVVRVQTDTGTLEIKTTDDDVQVLVEENGKTVEVLDRKHGTKVRLRSGEYDLRLADPRQDIRLDHDRIQIMRQGEAVATITKIKAAATAATDGKAILNSLGMKLALIPAGKFTMGSPPSEAGRNSDEDQHEVTITRPFYMGTCCVTVGQFRQFIQDTAYKPDGGDAWQNPGYEQTDNHPAPNVSWNDAVAFCKWLTKIEGREYRLPTEAQWEYACRAGAKTPLFFGDSTKQLARYAWYSVNSAGGAPYPVGLLRPNAWGLHDMYGNQWQWTADWYAEDYYRHSPPQDPTGPEFGVGRALRGTSCFIDASFCRSAFRHGTHKPTWFKPYAGFRVVLVDSKLVAPHK